MCLHAEDTAAERAKAARTANGHSTPAAGMAGSSGAPWAQGARIGPSPAASSEDAAGSSGSSCAGEGKTAELSNKAMRDTAMEDAGDPVHYFVMGAKAGWESASAWPPPDLAREPHRLFLGSAPASRRVPRTGSMHCNLIQSCRVMSIQRCQ